MGSRKVSALCTVTFLLLHGPLAFAASPDQPRIAIVYTSPHQVINEIIEGFKEVVRERFPQAQFSERHASGREEEHSTQVLSSINEQPDLLAPVTTPITKLAVKQARGKIPIVFMGVTDPVGAGVAKSLESPGLATGSSDLCPFAGLLQLTKEVLPSAKILGLPYNPSDQPAVFGRGQLLKLAPQFGFKIVDRQVSSASELPTEVRGLATRVDALLLGADNLIMENPAAVSTAALEAGKPSFACDTASVEKGAIAGVSVNYRDVGRSAGRLAVRVLSGENPGELPVAVLSSGGIVLNQKSACRAGIKLSPKLTAQASDIFNKDFACPDAQLGPNAWLYAAIAVALAAFLVILLRRRRETPTSSQG